MATRSEHLALSGGILAARQGGESSAHAGNTEHRRLPHTGQQEALGRRASDQLEHATQHEAHLRQPHLLGRRFLHREAQTVQLRQQEQAFGLPQHHSRRSHSGRPTTAHHLRGRDHAAQIVPENLPHPTDTPVPSLLREATLLQLAAGRVGTQIPQGPREGLGSVAPVLRERDSFTNSSSFCKKNLRCIRSRGSRENKMVVLSRNRNSDTHDDAF